MLFTNTQDCKFDQNSSILHINTNFDPLKLLNLSSASHNNVNIVKNTETKYFSKKS